jgi:hypothetical protein
LVSDLSSLIRFIVMIGALAIAAPALADTLTCSTWQGVRTCQDAHGYVSHETEWQGRTNGWDNRGDTWSASRWQGVETTTGRRPER